MPVPEIELYAKAHSGVGKVLRVSELAGLRWRSIHQESISIVPEAQKQAVKRLRNLVERSVPNVPLVFQ